MATFWPISGGLTAAKLHRKWDFHFGPFFLAMRDYALIVHQKLPQKLILGIPNRDFASRSFFAVTSAGGTQYSG